MEGQSGFLVHLSCQVKGLWVMPVGLCVAVNPCPGGQRAGAASRVGFLTSSPPQLNQIPHRSCDALMVFVQVSVYEVLKRQKHLSNLILANSCKPSVEQQQKKIPVKIRENACEFPHISQRRCGLGGSRVVWMF